MANENEAPGYMTYREAAIMFSLMQPDDAAKAIKATVDYYLYGTVPTNLDGVVARVFQIMHADIDRNAMKYQKTVERNRKNVQKRWGKADTTGIRVDNQSNTNLKPETPNVKRNLKQKHEGGMADKPPRASRFTPPTLAEVQAYVSERQSSVDPQGFIDFYAAKGWLVGKTPKKDWKAACRNAESWERWTKQPDKNRVRTSAEYRKEADFFG